MPFSQGLKKVFNLFKHKHVQLMVTFQKHQRKLTIQLGFQKWGK